MNEREAMIRDYVTGYNTFNVDQMIRQFDDQIIFENIQDGEINMTLNGIGEFKAQAQLAKSYFSERRQTIKSFKHSANSSEIEIEYVAVLAMDFPNGLKKGNELKLAGKSVFVFNGNRITRLTDISG